MRRTTLLALLLCSACGDATDPGQARPGDSLFDRLQTATLAAYPETNLPPALAAVGPSRLRVRSAPLDAARWVKADSVPESYRPLLPDESTYYLYKARPGLPLVEDVPAPRVLRDGRDYPAWNAMRESFPGEWVWWDEGSASLYAIATQPPRGVSAEGDCDSIRELGRFDLRRLGAPPEPATLVRPVTFEDVTRRSLLLPARASLDFQLGRLAADSLTVGVGVIDRAWQPVAGAVQRTTGGSDGASFTVAVVDATGRVTPIWNTTVAQEDVGRFRPAVTLDLSRWTGRDVTLRLATGPGPSGDVSFDWAVFTGLRLGGPPGRSPVRPHVVLICVDTLRRDRALRPEGQRAATPRISAWADQHALVFDDAVSTAPWTLPSTASLLTGLAVHQHGTLRFPIGMRRNLPTIASVLAQEGYETIGVADGGYLSAAFGFDSGFEHYDARRRNDKGWREAVRALATRRSERPLFLFLHTYSVHSPYAHDDRYEDPSAPYDGPLAGRAITSKNVIDPFRDGQLLLDEPDRAYIERLYDAGVARLDDLLAEVLEQVETHLAGQQVLVIVTSDHGEEFFEHGMVGHGQSLYEELLAVPLMVRFPDGSRAGRSDAPVSLLDVAPTILDAAGLSAPGHLPGRSLLGSLPSRHVRVAQFKDKAHAVLYGDFKLILGDIDGTTWTREQQQLFRLPMDLGEMDNLATAQPDRMSALAGFLKDYLARWEAPRGASQEGDTLDAELMSELRELGYLGGG